MENVQEVIHSEVNEFGQRVLSIIDEYETLLGLKHPENPKLESGETMETKIERSKVIFIEKVKTGSFGENHLKSMERDFSLLNLRVAHLVLDLKARREVVLVPSKRNYLYTGKVALLDTFEQLVEYENLADEIAVHELIKKLTEIATKADNNCENILEFKIVNILIMFLTLFTTDRQTISFLAQLVLTQEDIAFGS